jgi:gas vesicle protein
MEKNKDKKIIIKDKAKEITKLVKNSALLLPVLLSVNSKPAIAEKMGDTINENDIKQEIVTNHIDNNSNDFAKGVAVGVIVGGAIGVGVTMNTKKKDKLSKDKLLSESQSLPKENSQNVNSIATTYNNSKNINDNPEEIKKPETSSLPQFKDKPNLEKNVKSEIQNQSELVQLKELEEIKNYYSTKKDSLETKFDELKTELDHFEISYFNPRKKSVVEKEFNIIYLTLEFIKMELKDDDKMLEMHKKLSILEENRPNDGYPKIDLFGRGISEITLNSIVNLGPKIENLTLIESSIADKINKKENLSDSKVLNDMATYLQLMSQGSNMPYNFDILIQHRSVLNDYISIINKQYNLDYKLLEVNQENENSYVNYNTIRDIFKTLPNGEFQDRALNTLDSLAIDNAIKSPNSFFNKLPFNKNYIIEMTNKVDRNKDTQQIFNISENEMNDNLADFVNDLTETLKSKGMVNPVFENMRIVIKGKNPPYFNISISDSSQSAIFDEFNFQIKTINGGEHQLVVTNSISSNFNKNFHNNTYIENIIKDLKSINIETFSKTVDDILSKLNNKVKKEINYENNSAKESINTLDKVGNNNLETVYETLKDLPSSNKDIKSKES